MGYLSLSINTNTTIWYVRFYYISISLGIITLLLNWGIINNNIKAIRSLFILFFVFLILNFLNGYGEGHYLRVSLIMCSSIVGYVIGKQFGLDNSKVFFKFFAYVLFIYVLVFAIRLNGKIDYGTEEGYIRDRLFLLPFLFPFVIMQKKKKYCTLSLILILICSFISLKRSLVVTALLLIPTYMYNIMPNRQSNKVTKIILLFGIVLGAYYILPVIDEKLTHGVVMERLSDSQEDGGSGRDNIYEQYVLAILGSSPGDVLFGQQDDTGIITGNAHNDLLLITYRYGLMGLLFYLNYIAVFVKQAFWLTRQKFTNEIIHLLIWATIIPLLVLGMLNCFFDQCSFFYAMLLLGFIIGLSQNIKTMTRT